MTQGKDLNITMKDRGLNAKRKGLFSYLWTPADRELRAVGGTSDWSGHGLDQSGEKGEEIEGMLERCSPRAEMKGNDRNLCRRRMPTVEMAGDG
jgi:hypothetical protein